MNGAGLEKSRGERPAREGLDYTSEIAASSYAYPSESVSNAEYLRRCRFQLSQDPAALENETRMKSRRWCAPGENTATMTRAAVRKLVERHPELCAEIDAVVVASGTTMPMAHPSDERNRAFADLSPLVLEELGRPRALGVDIKACYCSGFLRALQVADGLLGNANYRSALVVAAEQGSKFALAETNRTSFCYLVADAAGAVVLRRSEGRRQSGVIDFYGYTDVSKLDWVGIGSDAASLIMMGSRAAAATKDMLVECGRVLLQRNGLGPRDVDWLIPIQTHAGLLDGVAQALEWPRDKMLWFGDVNGFSGSASIPSCLAEQQERGTVRKGQLVLSIAVGAGMNCAGAIYRC